MKKSFYFYLSFLFIFFVLFTGCNQNPFFGVGNAADIERPSVKVTSHTNGDYVKKTFTVEGECRDNIAVSKVVVNVKGESKNYDTNMSKTSDTTWKFKIDFDADQIGSGDKTFEFTAYDTTGNTETTRLFLFIDIDMPQIIISEPVLLTYDEILTYTDTFPDRNDFKNITFFNNKTVKIAGYIEDKFIIKQTTLQVYSENDELLKTVDIKK
ncbi:MAG TPA: Ig-like domain-containing protein, partial [Spirochaetota bacterium]|nr:Ig-like domain-containing protein [Spirochaetota bacterium]